MLSNPLKPRTIILQRLQPLILLLHQQLAGILGRLKFSPLNVYWGGKSGKGLREKQEAPQLNLNPGKLIRSTKEWLCAGKIWFNFFLDDVYEGFARLGELLCGGKHDFEPCWYGFGIVGIGEPFGTGSEKGVLGGGWWRENVVGAKGVDKELSGKD